jgi:hypothetical protein
MLKTQLCLTHTSILIAENTRFFPQAGEKHSSIPNALEFISAGVFPSLPETLVTSIAMKHKYYLVSETCRSFFITPHLIDVDQLLLAIAYVFFNHIGKMFDTS